MKTEKLIATLVLLIVVGYLVERHDTAHFTAPPAGPGGPTAPAVSSTPTTPAPPAKAGSRH